MNRYVIEFQAKAGKGDEAMTLFQEMKQYFSRRHQKTLEVYYQAFGTPGSFQVAMDFDNLGQLEAVAGELRRDPEYKALADRARNLFTDDSFRTTVYYRI
ncbi:MAG: hypothetical protein OWU84_00615 [Firmicutes bacterium]|nr:hypothetical protein [Bacillota bacterium]